MKILVLGDSDTSGRYAGGKPWPELLKASLEEAGRGPVELRAIPFSAASATAHEYAAKKVTEAAPDTIVMVLGSFAFTAKFSWIRIERMFGKRAGAWYKAIEDGFEDPDSREERGLDKGQPGRPPGCP